MPDTRTINGHSLKQNLTLTAGDIGAYSREETNQTFLPVNSRQAVTHGNLVIDSGTEWPGLRYKAANGYTVGIEGSGGKGLTVWADDPQGKRRYNLSTPQKSGTLATLEDIGQKSNIPVGSPVPWPQATPPSGYLAYSGQTFDKSVYPALGAAYPSGRLPDLRGEFIRGVDSGRGVDTGRSVLSEQMGNSLLCGRGFWNDDIFEFKMKKGSVGTDNQGHREFYQQIEGKNGNETRPRNIAFLYIVRAA